MPELSMNERRGSHVTVVGNDDAVAWSVVTLLDQKRIPVYGPLRSIANNSVFENGIVMLILTNAKESLETLVETGFLCLDCLQNGNDLVCVIEDYADKSSIANRAREIVKANARKNKFDVFDNLDSAISYVAALYDL